MTIDLSFELIIKLILGLSGILTALGVIHLKMIKPALAAIERFNQIASVIKTMEAQFKNNGGSSLRDAIDRIERKVNKVEKQVDRVDAFSKILMNMLMDEPVFISDGEGRCTWASSSYTNLVKRPAEELKGRGWESIIHPEDRDRVIKEWHDAIKAERSFDSLYRIVDSTGRSVAVRCRSAGNMHIGYLGVIEVQKGGSDARSR